MRTLILAAVILGSFTHTIAGDEPALEVLGNQLTYFYLNPSEEEFSALQQGIAMHYDELSSSGAGFSTLISVFLGKVHEKHGWSLLDIRDLDEQALSVADRDGSDLSRYVWDDTQIDPGKLDVWWTSFFATGDTMYLDKLINQVGDLEAQSGTENIMVMGAANWSVSANCRQHPAVLKYAKSVLRHDPPVPNRETLEEIVKQTGEPDG